MKKCIERLIGVKSVLFLSFLLSTYNLYANGVPVIFGVTVFHLIIVNFFVIAVEYILLKRFSGDEVKWFYIILANIASIFAAYILTDTTVSVYMHFEWFGLKGKGVIPKRNFVVGVFFFILFTIIVEWLFFYFAQRNKKNILSSLKYSAVINLMTNIPIAIFYLISGSYYDDGE